jgi:O-antigen/teichoic acid export membrane protein
VTRDVLFSISGRLFIALLNFAILFATASWFGPAIRGEASLLIANLAIVQLATDIVNGPGLIYLSKRNFLPRLFKASLVWTFGSSFLIISGLTLLGVSPSESFGLLFVLSCVFSVNIFTLQIILSEKKIRVYYFLQILQQALQLLLIVLAYHYGKISFHSFCLSVLIPLLLITPFSTFLAFRFRSSSGESETTGNTPGFLNILKTGSNAQVSNLFNFVATRISYYMIASDKEFLGVFSVAITICESVWIITYGFASILYPEIASSKNGTQNIRLTQNYLRYTMLLSATALIVLVCLPDRLFVWLLGAQYAGISDWFVWLAPGIFLMAIAKLLWNYFAGSGLFRLNNIAWASGSAVSVLATYVLLQQYGTQGLALATNLSYAVIALLLLLFFYRQKKQRDPSGENAFPGNI